MKKLLLIFAFIAPLLSAEKSYENYEPQNFFSVDKMSDFFVSKNGEVLKKIFVEGHQYLMEQDGDLFDEDVATLDDEVFSARSEKYSFGKSKRLLATKVYPSHQIAFYSGCRYKVLEKKLIPMPETCGFHYRKNKKRSERIEWEHIVPAWHFGYQLHCWQNGGRMTCRQTNSKFKQMEADMHNLVPAIGEINGDRSNFKYGMIEGEKRLYGKVDMEISFPDKRAEPNNSVYGDIARTYFYMRQRYGLTISNAQEKMFIAWNNLDPVSDWEKKRNKLIAELQGDDNPFVSNYKKMEQLGGELSNTPETPKESSKEDSLDFNSVKKEMSEKYSFILDKLSTFGEIILAILTLFVLYRRKQKKEIENKKRELVRKINPDNRFVLVSKLGEVALSFNDSDEVVIEKLDRTNPRQHWNFTKANKQKEYIFIESLENGKVVTVKSANSNDGAEIVLEKKRRTKNDHQEWKIESEEGSEYIFILNREVLNALDVKDKEITEGTRVQSFHKKVRGTENQEWRVEKL